MLGDAGRDHFSPTDLFDVASFASHAEWSGAPLRLSYEKDGVIVSQLIRKSANPSATIGSAPRIVVKRIHFQERSISGERIRRQFKQPRTCFAVEETAGLSELPTETPESDPTDCLVAVCVHPDQVPEWQSLGDGWLTPRNVPDAAQVARIEWNGVSICWLPGRAVITARGEGREDALAAVTEFAFYESELRRLEHLLEEKEPEIEADMTGLHQARLNNRRQWQRIGETAVDLSRMRMSFAKLRPRLANVSRSLRPNARRLVARFVRATDMRIRLESFNDRLKVCEELYTKAADRIAICRQYRSHHLLDLAIIFLLLIGITLIGSELYFR